MPAALWPRAQVVLGPLVDGLSSGSRRSCRLRLSPDVDAVPGLNPYEAGGQPESRGGRWEELPTTNRRPLEEEESQRALDEQC